MKKRFKMFSKLTVASIGAVGLLSISGCVSQPVEVKTLGEETYQLTSFFNEPVQSYTSSDMRAQAKQLCPKGHHYLLRTASKSAELGQDHATCAGTSACGYALQWRIQCTDRPEEKFSIFGKS